MKAIVLIIELIRNQAVHKEKEGRGGSYLCPLTASMAGKENIIERNMHFQTMHACRHGSNVVEFCLPVQALISTI